MSRMTAPDGRSDNADAPGKLRQSALPFALEQDPRRQAFSSVAQSNLQCARALRLQQIDDQLIFAA